MHICIYIYIHIYLSLYIYIYICTYTYTHMLYLLNRGVGLLRTAAKSCPAEYAYGRFSRERRMRIFNLFQVCKLRIYKHTANFQEKEVCIRPIFKIVHVCKLSIYKTNKIQRKIKQIHAQKKTTKEAKGQTQVLEAEPRYTYAYGQFLN